MSSDLTDPPIQNQAAERPPKERPAPGSRIRRPSLHEQVTGLLRERVLEGVLRPGSRIAEQRLCDELGVSRTPMREALKVLASEGLVRLLPNRGAVVTEVTLDEVEDLFQVMVALEELAARLIVTQVTDKEVDHLRDLHLRMVDQHRRARRADYFRTNSEFHRRLIECSGNTVLTGTHASLSVKVKRVRYLANMSVVRWQESVDEHAAIIEAMAARNAPALAERMGEHIRRTGKVVMSALRYPGDQALARIPQG